MVVVSIGINAYPKLRAIEPVDLEFAETDANEFAKLTKNQYGYEVVLITGGDATKKRIEATLERYGRELGRRDALIVFFAGHGKLLELPGCHEAGYLIPADADLDLDGVKDYARWAEQALDMARLKRIVEGMSAQHVLFIADACKSGFMTKRGSMERWDLKNFLSDQSRTIFTATTRRQNAKEDSASGRGYLTAAVIDALRDRTDAASVLDLYTPVLRTVSGKTNGTMQPQLAQVGEGDGMFVFVPLTMPKEEIEADIEDAPGIIAGRNRGIGGALSRALAISKQLTSESEFLATLEAPDYRLADRSDDLRIEWESRCRRFSRNAQFGDAWALAALSLCYQKGIGVEEDGARAYDLARRADQCERPAGLGRFLLGRCYQFEQGVSLTGEASMDEARRLYKESADLNFGPGLWASAISTLNAGPTQKEALAAKLLLERAIAKGVTAAKVDLAFLLKKGEDGVPRDFDRAFSLLEQAAAENAPRAFLHLVEMLTEDKVGYPPVDRKKAEAYLRRGVELGSLGSVNTLASEYFGASTRLGLPRDERQAYRLFDRASQREDGQALLWCAQMLATGRGTAVDLGMARDRLERSVATGFANAMQIQGEWYGAGTIYPRDEGKALLCFIEAADKGVVTSFRKAGSMFIDGRGFTPRDGLADGVLHDQWHRGLHYLMKAHELGGERDRKLATATAEHLIRSLKSDASSKRAKAVASAWARDYPVTFRYFYEHWSVDPRSFGLVPKGPSEH